MISAVSAATSVKSPTELKALISEQETFLAQLKRALETSTSSPPPAAANPVAATPLKPVQPALQTPRISDAPAVDLLRPASTPLGELSMQRPSVADFMSAAGVDADTASETIYGVMGSNRDYRDWTKILASADPLTSARQATAAMYNSDLPYAATASGPPSPYTVKAQSGNFAWVDNGVREGLYIVDSKGAVLRGVSFNPDAILRQAESFGLDTSKLADLADQLDAQGTKYRPGEVIAGNGSYGVHLREIAVGAMGSASDWRVGAQATLSQRLGMVDKATGAEAEAAKAAQSFAALLQLTQA